MKSRARIHELSDSALIHRFLDGDEVAFRALYARHTPRLRMIVWRLLGPRRDETDDVVQDTWLAGCRGIHGFNGNAKFSSWLTTIGIRAAYARCATPLRDETQLFDIASDASGDGPATAIDLERAIARLPAHQRAIVVLHDVEGFTHEEIAKQLGVAVGTSKGTLSRARSALRQMLNDGVSHVP
ncbi:MAG: RNA polymerase sigma factor [Gemmatimonadaceae bacterium]